MSGLDSLTPEQWAQFDRDGFLVLGKIATDDQLAALNARLDDIMLGRVQYGERLLMQMDPNAPAATADASCAATKPVGSPADGSGDPVPATAEAEIDAYKRVNAEASGQTVGFKHASLAYRKVGEAQAGLECDPVFRAFMTAPLMRHICDRVYGRGAAVAVYRAMVMSKPAGDMGGGTPLPWHQDGGDWWALDRHPLCFVWTALSPATRANGAVQVVRGSHKLGLLSQRGHTLGEEDVRRVVDAAAARGDVVDVELQPGEAFLCHNWTVHRSGTNTTHEARRGFSVNYVHADTRVLDPKPPLAGPLGKPGEGFPLVFPAAGGTTNAT